MTLTDSQRYQIESFVKEKFGLGLSRSDLYDLTAEALVFISNDDITRLNKASLNALETHLRKYRIRMLREKRGHVRPESSRVDFISDLQVSNIKFAKRLSEEEKLANLSARAHISLDAGIESAKLEDDLKSSEQKLAAWKSQLPAMEYEALELAMKGVTPCLMMGLTDWGRWIFYRRARMRMKWINILQDRVKVGSD